jgi:rhodanese-related sulfurtransferase
MQHFSAPQLAQALGAMVVAGEAGDAAPTPAAQRLQLLDVREPWEIDIVSLPGSIYIPMGEITARFEELNRDEAVVCICHHGVRSLQVGMFLERQGFENVINLSGGIDAWSKSVDPSYPSY